MEHKRLSTPRVRLKNQLKIRLFRTLNAFFLLQKYRKEDKLSTNKKDLTGHKFNSLTAIERLANYKNNKTYYRCKCDCGNERIVYGYDLTSG